MTEPHDPTPAARDALDPGPFRFGSVAHLETPAGIVATNLETLRSGIAEAPDDSLFQHVLRIPVRYPHARDLPVNDFARWVGTALQNPEASERLAFAGTAGAQPIPELRAALLSVLDSVPQRDRKRESAEGASFHFVRTRSVVVPLPFEARDAVEAIELWHHLDSAAIFFHLIEAPVFGDRANSFPAWLRAHGAEGIAIQAEQAVAAGRPIARLRRDLGTRWRRSQIGRRIAERAGAPEAERQREARAAISRLAGRLRGGKRAGAAGVGAAAGADAAAAGGTGAGAADPAAGAGGAGAGAASSGAEPAEPAATPERREDAS